MRLAWETIKWVIGFAIAAILIELLHALEWFPDKDIAQWIIVHFKATSNMIDTIVYLVLAATLASLLLFIEHWAPPKVKRYVISSLRNIREREMLPVFGMVICVLCFVFFANLYRLQGENKLEFITATSRNDAAVLQIGVRNNSNAAINGVYLTIVGVRFYGNRNPVNQNVNIPVESTRKDAIGRTDINPKETVNFIVGTVILQQNRYDIDAIQAGSMTLRDCDLKIQVTGEKLEPTIGYFSLFVGLLKRYRLDPVTDQNNIGW